MTTLSEDPEAKPKRRFWQSETGRGQDARVARSIENTYFFLRALGFFFAGTEGGVMTL
jgi:hypothetical protein